MASTTIVCTVPEKTLFHEGWDGHGEKFTSEDADIFVINDQGSIDDYTVALCSEHIDLIV